MTEWKGKKLGTTRMERGCEEKRVGKIQVRGKGGKRIGGDKEKEKQQREEE